VTNVRRLDAVFERMAERSLILQVHGEVTDPSVDIFDREARFIDRVLAPLVERHRTLRVVFEHATTRAAVDFVRGAREGVAATVTPQHLMLNRNALFQGGIRPHLYCLPVLKRESDREALRDVVARGEPRFFLGTDSAPHARHLKEAACGCAGIFSAHAGIELYAEVFEQLGALNRLEDFASHFGADFYRLPRNAGTLTLERRAWTPPPAYPLNPGELVPLRAGESIVWMVRA
jgi:dihydroorotase